MCVARCLASAIADFIEPRGIWEGTATDLLAAISAGEEKLGPDRPRSPRALGGRLRSLASALASIGITVDFELEANRNRRRLIFLSSES